MMVMGRVVAATRCRRKYKVMSRNRGIYRQCDYLS